MKFYLIVFTIFCCLQEVQPQMLPNVWDYYDKYSMRVPTEQYRMDRPFLVCAIPKRVELFDLIRDGKYISDSSFAKKAFAVWKDSSLYKDLLRGRFNGGKFISLDTLPIHLFCQGINRENARRYKYRFVKNDSSTLRDWTTPIEFIGDSYISGGYGENDSSMAFLGTLTSEFRSLVRVDIIDLDSNKIFGSTRVYWLDKEPEVLASFSNENFNEFMKVFEKRARNRFNNLDQQTVDSLIVLRTKFPAQNRDIILLIKDVVKERVLQYRVDGSDWISNEFDFQIVWLKNLTPGKHKVELRYDFNPTGISQFEFEILPAWHQTLWFKLLMVLAGATVVGLIVLLYRNQQQKRFIKEQANSKRTKELELTTIRSQLNPHFVLNALNSIQSVFLTRPKEEANKYLTNFGNLMRDTLGKNSKEWTSLQQEITLLKDYLELEQLRFGFGFQIKIDQSIDPTTVEVPTLLLQPLVENAIKHGISGIRDKGMVEIIVEKNKTDMLIIIRDNGNGGITVKPEGQGLQLTIDRLHLIKEINPTQIIEFDNSRSSTVILTFNNWLAV